MNNIYNLSVDLKQRLKHTEIEIPQLDQNTQVFNIKLTQNGVDYPLEDGVSVELAILKPDGTFVVINGNVTTNLVNFTLTDQALAVPGNTKAEVRIIADDKLLTSTQFTFFIRETIVNNKRIESTSEFKALEQLVTKASEVQAILGEVNVKELQTTLEPIKNDILNAKTEIQESINLADTKKAEIDQAITNLEIALADFEENKGEVDIVLEKINKLETLISSASDVDGEINSKMAVVQDWIDDPSQFKGDKGDPGPKGDTGPKGDQGPAGVNATTTKVATTTENGLMSSADKGKLDGIESNAQQNTVASVNGKKGIVKLTKADVGLNNVNNVAITAEQVTKINELNYTRAMTQEQYNALSQTEKDRTDVWYGIYKE